MQDYFFWHIVDSALLSGGVFCGCFLKAENKTKQSKAIRVDDRDIVFLVVAYHAIHSLYTLHAEAESEGEAGQ